MPKEQAYGQYFIGADDLPSEHAERIVGFRVGRAGDAEAPVTGIDLHYVVAEEGKRMTIPLDQAMYLLMLLKAMQLNEELPFPEDPRDPTWRPPGPTK